MIAPHILHPREYRNHQSWPTRRRWLWLVAIFLLAATRQAMPAQVPIGSAQDIADNSIVISGNYQINPGNEYTFTAPVNVYTSSAGNVTFTGDSLIADASVGRLTAGMVNIGGGTVAATGSAGAAGIHGIYSYRLSTQTGGTVDLYGGGATGSYGWFANRGYILADGVLNSRGGSAANAYGIYGSAYNLQVDGGTMNNYAGTVSGAHGARSNTVNINGGVVNAYGYTEANQSTSGAYGLYASNLNITGGVLNARSGTAAESRGAYFYTVNQSGGTVNLTGNAASLASGRNHAMYVIRYNLTGGSVVANGGGANSQGLYANQLQVSNDGSLTATGGDGGTGPGQYGYGLDAGSITINAGATGTVRGVGGSGGINSYGISTDRITQNGGNLAGDGGSVRSAYGISASSLEMANDATLTGIGGTGDYSYGVSIRTINHNSAGLVLARGNTGTDSYGIQASAFNQNAGAVQAVGGGGVNAVGMRVNGTITITGGTVDADGGGASGAHGFYANYYAQDGGDVVADGNGADAGGVRVYYSAVISAGTVAATGGGGANSYGFYTGTTFTLESGTVQADGGAGVGADGVRINTAATVNGGGIVAGGGGAANADGVHAGSLALADGTVEAVGGTAADAVGVRVNNALTIAGGTIQATGSASAQADGVAAGSLSLDAGTIQADGGGSADAAGMRISGAATLSGGRLDAVGGGADRAYGLSAGSLSQNAGTATASAGGGQAAHGIAVAGLASIGAGGNLTATGGDSGTYGLSAGSFDLSGLLRMERGSSSGVAGASVYVDSPDGTVLRGGSVLAPVVDIGRGVVNGSGLLQTVPGGTVVIENGARLDFWFIDHRNMSKQVVYDDYVFIDTGELAGGPFGSIVNEFVEQSGGLSLEYIARKNEFGQYVLSVKRVLDIPEIIDMVPCANARRLMGIFDDLYDPGDVLISRVLMAVDHSRDRADLVRISAHIGKTLTPTAYSKLTGTQLRAIELVQDSVQRRLAVLSAASRSEAAAYPGAVVAVPRWTVWADALHQQSSRFKPACVEFDSPKEKLYGVSTGLAGEYQNLAFAAGFGYVAGSYRSGYSDIDTDNYSLTAGLTLRGAEGGGWFVPSATLVAGYAYGDIDQHLLNYPGDGWKRSSPAAHMARASLELAAETRFGPFTVAPFVGLDYAFIRQQGYSENDPAGFGLRVRANNFNSLRPRVGVALEMRPSDRLAIGLRAQYRIEALDRRSSFTYGRISAPEILIPFAGEDRNRHSGDIGATARYRLNDRAHLSGEYRLLIEDKYLANRFGIGLEVAF